jgi:hypothetical protein
VIGWLGWTIWARLVSVLVGRVYGWVLMGNHYHLLAETSGANLVSGMQWLQTAYTVWFNRRHRLSGHLFGGRYKAVLIDQGEPESKMLFGYLGTVLDYLHLKSGPCRDCRRAKWQAPAGLSLEQPDGSLFLQCAQTPALGVRGEAILSFWIEG